MIFSSPIQRYNSHADPIWPDGIFKGTKLKNSDLKFFSLKTQAITSLSSLYAYCTVPRISLSSNNY